MIMKITKEDLPKITGRFIYEVREKDGKAQYLDISRVDKNNQEFLFLKRVKQVMYSTRSVNKENEESCLTMYDYIGNPIHTETIEGFVQLFNKKNIYVNTN